MTDATNAIRKIHKMMGEIEVSLSINRSINEDELSEMGYSVTKIKYDEFEISKDGLAFPVWTKEGRYYTSGGFYFGPQRTYFYNMCYLPSSINELIKLGFNPSYERSRELQELSDLIVGRINETIRIVESTREWTLGNTLRRMGYFVAYDGSSVCNFVKDGIVYSAVMTGVVHWKVSDSFNVYVADGVPSKKCSLSTIKNYIEGIMGNVTKLGRRMTEKDLISEYKRFRVRTYADRTLKTIKWFDDFESARKYAYDYAVELARKVEPRYRRWAHNPPLDWSDRNDYLALYIWYMHDSGCPHAVFVQGEHE